MGSSSSVSDPKISSRAAYIETFLESQPMNDDDLAGFDSQPRSIKFVVKAQQS